MTCQTQNEGKEIAMKVSWIALLLCIVFIISGCNQASSDPPPSLVVRSLDDFHRLLDPETASTVSAYSAGLGHRDVNTVLSAFKSIGYPEPADSAVLEDFSFTCQDDSSVYDLNYWVDGIQYRTQYQRTDEVLNRSFMIPITTCNIAERTINLYQGSRGLVGEFYEGDYRVMIMVYGYDRLEDIDFSQFTWIIPTDHTPAA
jgi:hypothetical protein